MKSVVAVIRNLIELIRGSGSMIRIEKGHKRSQKRGLKYICLESTVFSLQGRSFTRSFEAFIEAQEEINRK